MTKAHNIASFVLRFTQELWLDTEGEPHIRWRGHIRYVQGNEENRFTDFAEAVAFMQHHLTHLTAETLSAGENANQEHIFRESVKLWEQFASSYADLMSNAIERSVKQSETFQERVDEVKEQALNTWFFYSQPSHEKELLDAVGDLQKQVQSLTEKVDNLEETVRRQIDKS